MRPQKPRTYAVYIPRQLKKVITGTWNEVFPLVNHKPGAATKKIHSEHEAEEFFRKMDHRVSKSEILDLETELKRTLDKEFA